jgi:dUTP pyrophosphatase
MNISICKLHPDATTPAYAAEGSACFDLHAILDNDVHADAILPGCSFVVRTGLAFEVPPGHVLQIFSRSGHGFKHGVRLANGTGIVDADYRGEVLVCLHNDNPDDAFVINNGDRIAQAMVVPVPRVTFRAVEQLSITERGAGGFGSTGK